MATHHQPWLIVIAASAGGVEALVKLIGDIPTTIPAAIVIVQHRTPTAESLLGQILARRTKLPVHTAMQGQHIRAGAVYIARPDFHLTVLQGRRFGYVDGAKIRGVRSSANPLLETAAGVYGPHAIAVVLTGSGLDATDGVQTVKARGGIVIAQDPATAKYGSMPAGAVSSGAVDHILPLDAIVPALVAITEGHPIKSAPVN